SQHANRRGRRARREKTWEFSAISACSAVNVALERESRGRLNGARKLPGAALSKQCAELLIGAGQKRLIGVVIGHVQHVQRQLEAIGAEREGATDTDVPHVQRAEPQLSL